ncbi:hypothetical protein HPULCUR_004037 [Helicostylum pulchrum]|uniref:Derlin n=1 Tax=Helicostylum pulchrum TaxID=562976 RepID=A0ABP9XV40_9FUNG
MVKLREHSTRVPARYSRMMEEGFFRNKPADYVWLMLFSASLLIALSIFVPFAYLPFMGSALSFTMVYIWARRNPYVRLNFLGLIIFTAPYLPWVLLLFSLCLGGQIPVGDILGVLVGHIYYFFEDVWPRDPLSHGKKWLATPRLIRWLVEGNRARDDSIEIPEATEAEIVTENIVPEEEVVAAEVESEGTVNEQSSQTKKEKDTVTDDVTAGTSIATDQLTTLDEKTDLLQASSSSYVSSQSSSASTNNISLQQTTEKDKSE